MRILFAGKQHYDPGGIPASTHQLALALGRRGHEVAVVAHTAFDGPPHSPRRRTLRREAMRGYTAYSVDLLTPGAALGMACRAFGPDVIVVNAGGSWWHDWTEPLCAAAPRNLPLVVYVRDRGAIELLVEGAVHPDVVVANAEAHAAELGRHGIEVVVVPSVVEPDAYRVEPTGESVVFINPVRSKGVDTAFALAAARPAVPFEFRESWILRPDLRREVEERAAAHANVRFLPHTDDQAEPYRRARVLLVPYEDGNRPRVVHEAQVSGIPILARDDPALREAVGPGGALVAPDAGVDAWATALDRLWDDGMWPAWSAAASEHAARLDIDPAHVAGTFAATLEDARRVHTSRAQRPRRATVATSTRPVASVIVPVRDVAATIDDQLDALANQTFTGPWELIVADNGSRDATRQHLDDFRARLDAASPVVRLVDASTKRGVAHARNTGAEVARGEVLLICDGDDIVAPDWLELMVGALDEHPIVTGCIDLVSLNDPETYEWSGDADREDVPIAYGHRPYAPGGNIGMWRDVFDLLGGFDETLRRAEDIDFSWRAADRGIAVHCEPAAVLHRRIRTSLRATFVAGWRGGLAEPHLFRRHRARGMKAAPVAHARAEYRWLVRQIPEVARGRVDRYQWAHHAGKRLGRIVGSARAGALYL